MQRLIVRCNGDDISDALEKKNGSRSFGGYSYAEFYHGSCFVMKLVCGGPELTEEAKTRGYSYEIEECYQD
jgi:hypothetical protein